MKFLFAMVCIIGSVFGTAGEVKFLTGLVSVNGKPAKLGSKISAGDTLAAGPASAADVLLEEGLGFRVRENSRMIVTEYRRKGKPSLLTVIRGYLQVVARRPVDLTIKTPTSAAAIRGTFFFTRVDDRGTYFCTCNGSVLCESGSTYSKNLTASHHGAVLITAPGKGEDAGMEDHADVEIFELLFNLER